MTHHSEWNKAEWFLYNLRVRLLLVMWFMEAAKGVANSYNGAHRAAQYNATAQRHMEAAREMLRTCQT